MSYSYCPRGGNERGGSYGGPADYDASGPGSRHHEDRQEDFGSDQQHTHSRSDGGNMMTLGCAFAGLETASFTITVNINTFVGELKKTLKAEHTTRITGDAVDVHLFVAKLNDQWMDTWQAQAVTIDPHGRPVGLTAMDPLLRIKNALPLTGLREGQIHVLVALEAKDLKRSREGNAEVPPTQPKLSYLQKLLKGRKKSGNLPQDGDFLKLFEWGDSDCGNVKGIRAIGEIVNFTGSQFYLRKEVLCVLKNFKHFLDVKFGEITEVNPKKQFIFVGSPGTGKSCILALICFYLAIEKKVPVVWFRDSGDETSVTRLFDKGKYYEWIDRKGTIYDALCTVNSGIDQARCWFCLDGLNQKDIKDAKLDTLYTLLATSGQFQKKGTAGSKQATCLLPYWRQDDLEKLAGKVMTSHVNDFTDRYFVSGGNLRDFLLPIADATDLLSSALRTLTVGDVDVLLTTHGCSSNQQIDRIRMMGVVDNSNADQYLHLDWWRPCVSSMKALQHLVDMMKPKFFLMLVASVKGMNDPRLQGIAFEYLFRSLVRCQRSVHISFVEYDNVDRRKVKNYADFMRGSGTITLGRSTGSSELLQVKREGASREDHVNVMARWAANPDEMDYWVPASSVCETIDAVAKWELSTDQGRASNDEPVKRFCFLQMTMATKHKWDESILLELAKPFLANKLEVCFMVILFGDDTIRGEKAEDKVLRFRLSPVAIKSSQIKNNIPVYVATYMLNEA